MWWVLPTPIIYCVTVDSEASSRFPMVLVKRNQPAHSVGARRVFIGSAAITTS